MSQLLVIRIESKGKQEERIRGGSLGRQGLDLGCSTKLIDFLHMISVRRLLTIDI
jgi:hypothetical protein